MKSETIFMHFQNSCTQNCDHHILFIMTGNALKESCLKLLLILKLVREKGLYILKLIVATKWWLLSQLKTKLFIGKPIFNCSTAAFLFIFVVLSS